MNPVVLTEEQERSRKEIEQGIARVRELLGSDREQDRIAARKLVEDLGANAHSLHIGLKAAGSEPRHHRYMIQNRGMSPDHPRFYCHVHPLEDLLRFLKDPSANDDPEDQTLGQEFALNVYSARWGHTDLYRVTRTKAGWDVEFAAISGSCDRSGHPYLFENLRHDGVSYPEDLGDRLEYLWERARDRGLSKSEVQDALNQLAQWIELVEKNAPRQGVWSDF